MTQTVLLGDEIELIGGGTPKTSIAEYWGGDIPWISVVDFGGDRRWIETAEKKITDAGLHNSSTKLLQPGDIIISARGTVGELAQLKKQMAFNQSCYGLRAKENLNQDYLYYLLKQSITDLQRQAHGGVFSTITRETFQHIKVSLPSLESQKKIADILGAIDEKIELNRKMSYTLEQMGQALFRQYFSTNLEAVEKGKTTLGKIINPKRGKSLTSKQMIDGDVPVVSGGLQPAGKHNEANTIAPVITVSASGANAGYVALWGNNVWSADSSFIDTTVTSDVYFYYIFLKINQEKIYGMQTGAAQPHIYPSHLELLEIPNVSSDSIRKFNHEVSTFFERIENNKQEIQSLTTLRDSLLPHLISGRISL